jgi:hypothetical protein
MEEKKLEEEEVKRLTRMEMKALAKVEANIR